MDCLLFIIIIVENGEYYVIISKSVFFRWNIREICRCGTEKPELL